MSLAGEPIHEAPPARPSGGVVFERILQDKGAVVLFVARGVDEGKGL